MIIYVDLVFLENSIINFFILELVGFIDKDKKKFIRIIISSFFGSLFSIISFYIEMGFLKSIIYKFLISFFMILIAFGRKSLIRKVIFFYVVTFILGGVCLGILYLDNSGSFYIRNGILFSDFSIFRILVSVFLGLCFSRVVVFLIKKISVDKDLIYDIEIGFGEKIGVFKVLMDSGNLLKEPSTGKPVIIVEKSSLNMAFGVDLFDINKCKQFYVIPYSSLGNESGALVGISCDYVRILNRGDNIKNSNVVIGVYDGKIGSSDLYCGLIGAEVL